MLKLDLRREPYWLDLVHGVRVRVRPLTTAVMRAAQAALGRAGGEDGERAQAFLVALAQAAIIEWEGVGNEAGEPAPVTPDYVAALMDMWAVADAFERLYLAPALLLEQEKNA